MKKYEHFPREAECPVCLGRKAQRIWSVNSQEAAQHYVLRERDFQRHSRLVDHIENLWGQERCEILKCNTCGFCFSHPFVAGDATFYELAYDGRNCPREKWEFRVTREALRDLATRDTRLLEIGAGEGAFIQGIAESLIRKENIFCTEYSDYGRRKIEQLGVTCYLEDIRKLSDSGYRERFDIVCMFQVLEHMDRLDDLFHQLNWLMKTEGSLFIAVPNADRIEFNELNGALKDMPPNHIGRWNRTCFEKMGQKHGYKVHDYRTESYHFASMTKQFVLYRYLQRSRRPGTLENQLERRKHRPLFRVLRLIGVAVNLIIALPSLRNRQARVGENQWVHLIKDKNTVGVAEHR